METLFLKSVEVIDCTSFDAILILPVFKDLFLLKWNFGKNTAIFSEQWKSMKS